MGRITEEKPLPLRVYDSVYTKSVNDWDLSKEVFVQFMYPVIEKCAIMFPDEAMSMSTKGVNGYHAAVCLNELFNKMYRLHYQRSWMKHQKPKAIKSEAEKADNIFNDSIVRGYCNTYHVDYNSVKEAINRFPDEMKKELKEYKTDFIDNVDQDDDIVSEEL